MKCTHLFVSWRRGCSRTALEFCKFLLSLDLHDPLYILLAIDHYALRCKELDFLIELSYSDLFSERDLNSLPNFAFSLALAKFYIEKGMCSKVHFIYFDKFVFLNVILISLGTQNYWNVIFIFIFSSSV
jgi:hypothetical protein